MDRISAFQPNIATVNKFKDIQPGWTVKVFQRIKEGAKTRVQAFEGIVLARKHGQGLNGMITVRRISGGIGVEKVFPIHLPTIEKVEVLKKADVRRAKLYYLREKSSRELKRKIRQIAE